MRLCYLLVIGRRCVGRVGVGCLGMRCVGRVGMRCMGVGCVGMSCGRMG